MSYVDYSSHWVLDQFFTFLESNQLGSNDKHIVDNFSVEHNWSASVVDGTHKANSILGSYINKNPVATGSQVIGISSSWTPSTGIYQVAMTLPSYVSFEIFISGSWRGIQAGDTIFDLNGSFFCDGSNMRFTNNWTSGSQTVYYQKF